MCSFVFEHCTWESPTIVETEEYLKANVQKYQYRTQDPSML